jgi:hypothetical protein
MKPLLSQRVTILVGIVIAAGGTVIASIEFKEIGAAEYRSIRNSFKIGSPQFQRRVAVAMSDGVILRWEYDELNRISANDEQRMVLWTQRTSIGEERIVLAAMARQVARPMEAK